MAFTKVVGPGIHTLSNITSHNIHSSGIITAVGLDVNGNGDISGNLSVGGVLTYEDVTSIDSVGIITARSGIQGIGIQSGGLNVAVGVLTALNFIGAGNTVQVNGNTIDISIAGGSGGGAVGTGTDKVFYENDITVAQSYTISSGKNAMSAGPITLGGSVVVTIPNGSVWTVV